MTATAVDEARIRAITALLNPVGPARETCHHCPQCGIFHDLDQPCPLPAPRPR